MRYTVKNSYNELLYQGNNLPDALLAVQSYANQWANMVNWISRQTPNGFFVRVCNDTRTRYASFSIEKNAG